MTVGFLFDVLARAGRHVAARLTPLPDRLSRPISWRGRVRQGISCTDARRADLRGIASPPRMSARRFMAWTIMLASLAPLAACGPAPRPDLGAAAARHGLPYRIGPGDTLSVFVYGAPDLSVHGVPVRPDGRFSMPLVTNIDAAGKTTTELTRELTGRLKKYVKSPIVTVMVDSFHGAVGSDVYITGGGGKPQAVPYVDGMTLLDVMTQIGGLPEYADGNAAYIIRRADGHDRKIRVRIGALLNRGDLSQNVQMQPGDVIVIPQSWF